MERKGKIDRRKNKRMGDARNKRNKAGYTATPVAYGRAGAVFEVSGAFGHSDGPTKRGVVA